MKSLAQHITFRGDDGPLSFRAVVDATCSPSVARLIDGVVEDARLRLVLYGRETAEKRVLDVVGGWVDERLVVCDARGRWEMVP